MPDLLHFALPLGGPYVSLTVKRKRKQGMLSLPKLTKPRPLKRTLLVSTPDLITKLHLEVV